MPDKSPKDVEQIVNDAMKPVLGATIGELTKDISAKLEKSPLIDFDIDTKASFKQAKKKFKQQFLSRLLRVSYGNISEVAKKAGVDRRSIHRVVKDAGIDVARMREEMLRPYEVKQKAIGNIIGDVLDHYKNVIHPDKIAAAYKSVTSISKDILDELPDKPLTLKQAEAEFEKEYIKKVASEGKSLSELSKKIGIRYETLLRKMKTLGLR